MPGIEPIDSILLTSDAASVTFSNIPDRYGSLRIIYSVKSAFGGGFYDSFDWLWMQINSVTDTCYSIDGISPSGNGTNAGWFQLNAIAHSGAASQMFAAGEIDLHGHNNTAVGTYGMTLGGAQGYASGSGYSMQSESVIYSLLSTRPIVTSLSFKCRLGNMKSGSRIDIYGLTK